MKRLILAIQMVVLAAVQAMAYDVDAGGKSLTVTVAQSGTTYTIGNGRNACMPHYETGVLTIPRITSDDSDDNVVGQFAFRFCSGITRIVVEEGIDAIEDFAFIGCGNVTSIVLPASLKKVGRGAFIGLPRLAYIECKGTTPPEWQRSDVFAYQGTAESMADDAMKRVLYVPSGYTDTYAAAKYSGIGWGDAFARIYEKNSNPQEIGSLADLKAFRDAVNSGELYKESDCKEVTLTADIDMSGESWTPIGTQSNPYDGIFNGNGHVVRNLYVELTTDYAGLFGYAKNATIYNMYLQNPQVRGNDYVGSLVGYVDNSSRISDILVTNTASGGNDYTVKASSGSGGGIVGRAANATIERCMFRGMVKCSGWTGGIIGNVGTNVTITDCSASNYIQNLENGDKVGVPYTGGIVGGAGQVTIERCLARNLLAYTITNPTQLPGILVGGINKKLESTIRNCAYWDLYEGRELIQTHEYTVTDVTQGNTGYSTEGAMTQDKTKEVLGEDHWHYFTGNYIDFPVPATLADMYIKNFVDATDESGLTYRPVGDIFSPTGYEVAGYTGNGAALTIPDTYNEKDVTAVLDGVFQGNATLSAITMGTKLQTVGRNAFRDCDALTAIDLPDAVTTVGEDAFRHCDNLASFNIGKGFKDHDDNFLAYCPKLTDITCSRGNDNGYLCVDNVLLHNVSGYGSYVVACATGKTGDYVIPTEQLTQSDVFLLRNCFASCTGLTSITFPGGKSYELGGSLFNEASNLKVVDLSEVTQFRNDATYTASRSDSDSPFYGLNERTLVYLPHGHGAEQTEPNILIMNSEGTAATANAVLLAEGWDFLPKVPVTAVGGVSYRRAINYVGKDENDDYVPQGLTVCLPYDLTLPDDDATVYAPSAVETVGGETTVTFTEVASKEMTAYTPYYIVMQNDQELDFSTDASITISTPPDREPEAIGTYMFKGTTAEIPNSTLYDADRPAYLLQTDGQWHKVPQNQPKAYAGPFRAYFQATDAHAARALGMVLEHHHHDGSEPSAIVQVRTIGNDGTECYYDLNGRRLAAKPQKGIYVTGGKSYISK